ncbi:ribosome-binding factor A [Wolbachia pipientis]|uniref:Ribosome-binding factor A n=1 Tax=Wolbachia pipientis TaxID=955 RepID=A0A1E7QK55_WOLPI|nr:30S ribosome-binding factor RbfA [Wolbachia pipientis]OEY86851.1 ribosome-binding factor A [Wolbachia pipientis]
MKKEIRNLKVASVLHRALSMILMKNNILSKSVLISAVKLSKDLNKANVYIVLSSANGESDNINPIINEINQSIGLIRKYLSQYVNLRFIPELVFKPDLAFNNFININQILQD